jgi:hypothetical protein
MANADDIDREIAALKERLTRLDRERSEPTLERPSPVFHPK